MCEECLDGYNVYEKKCYSECNNVGARFTAIDGFCEQCPVGCDVCNADYECSVCLANYSLVDTSCVLTCSLDNTCETVESQKDVLPLPGLISVGLWMIIVVLLKLFIRKLMYFPYAYIYGGALI